ncbi:SAM-dependent RNA methyltransferase [Chaetomium fimeti]|uniref:SAM-dependent RNA methyltransferase n=1 Tax=Chaetomium fimeti TaxID=1854472 RepID=A0AAE0HHX9_9PEZI|nr:SAM-dependent RNA methyltransferase [Chaetomium fimeti]
MAARSKTYIVEHLDPELGAWSELEYLAIARESQDTGAKFCLSSLPQAFKVPGELGKIPAFKAERQGVEQLYEGEKSRVCLLDPAAASDLSPEDGDKFDTFLFGGILGDDPPRDRTSELRKKGFEGRRLGPVQMTTDTAVRVTRLVVQGKSVLHWLVFKRTTNHASAPLKEIPYLDYPELKFNEHESTEMPFRYVKSEDGKPIMPEVSPYCSVI